MTFCIFNSLPMHYEMYAHVLDYFKEKNTHIDIYSNKVNHHGWLDFYEKNFSVISWFPISFFNAEAYDYVFLLTDDDYGYTPFWNDKTRVIVIEHYGKRHLNLRSYFTLQTRQFKLRNPPSDPNTSMLPVWNNPMYEKFEKLTVLSIGSATNTINLSSLFSNFTDIHFILVDRHMNTASKESNITRYNSLNASQLVEFAAKSHYIIFWPTTQFSQEHKHNSMSGSFPLAFSVGTPLILPESFTDTLGLEGLTIPDSPLTPIHLEKPRDELITRVLKQRDDLLKKRNRIYDSLFFGLSKKDPGIYTAVMVEPRKHGAMEFVLKNFLEQLDERWNFMLFHGLGNKEWLEDIISKFPDHMSRITLVNLGIQSMVVNDYSKLLTSEHFIEQIPTETFLVFQTDTMISPLGKDLIYEFIDYDYVGAPWPKSNLRESCNVGNGGLSLRKKSKMLEIIRSTPYLPGCNEDLFYCINHTIPLYKPTWEKARVFSIESIYSPRAFGVHKAWKYFPIEQLQGQFPGIETLKILDNKIYK